ncbi:MAG: hypothetical protein IJP15_00855 [Oscillospiraceae bacterium]|nr:hypothetical protein [Oscillospiraceae bacterium]
MNSRELQQFWPYGRIDCQQLHEDVECSKLAYISATKAEDLKVRESAENTGIVA